jgi:hypothetical protein
MSLLFVAKYMYHSSEPFSSACHKQHNGDQRMVRASRRACNFRNMNRHNKWDLLLNGLRDSRWRMQHQPAQHVRRVPA